MQIASATVVVLALGVFIGVQMQVDHEEGIYLVATAQSGRIAVVNQDLGAASQEGDEFLEEHLGEIAEL